MDNQGSGMKSGEYEAVVQDVKNLKSDTKNLKNDSAALAGEMQNRANDAIDGTLSRIEDTVADIWHTISRTSTESYEAVERNVEQRPITSVLAAFVAGAAIGWVLDRTSSRSK
jgi:ElaB/YqjD/DUF883 family membrane-anchored ribosome-binding protein